MVFYFESSSSRVVEKFEYRVEYRVAIAVVGSVILDVIIIISDIAVILSRLDWILKIVQSLLWNCVAEI